MILKKDTYMCNTVQLPMWAIHSCIVFTLRFIFIVFMIFLFLLMQPHNFNRCIDSVVVQTRRWKCSACNLVGSTLQWPSSYWCSFALWSWKVQAKYLSPQITTHILHCTRELWTTPVWKITATTSIWVFITAVRNEALLYS